VLAVQRIQSDVIFTTSQFGFGAGFTYMPDGVHVAELPAASGVSQVLSQGGGWYAWNCADC